jgi:hypothetical protein
MTAESAAKTQNGYKNLTDPQFMAETCADHFFLYFFLSPNLPLPFMLRIITLFFL